MGAGPAGSAAGRALSLGGLRVFLADKELPGSKKVCGGFMGPEAAGLWKDLKLEDEFRAFPKKKLSQTTLSSPFTLPKTAPFKETFGYSIDREQFDKWLFEKAGESGATLSPYTAFLSASFEQKKWTAWFKNSEGRVQSVSSEILIYANGRRAPQPGRLSRQRNFFACKTVYENISEFKDSVSLHFVRKGHVGFNPQEDGKTAMCLYVEGRYFQNCKGKLDDMMTALSIENATLQKILKNARRVSDWQVCLAEPDGQKIFFKDHAFYAGDAVTMIEPMIGGGMPVAMSGGINLANALLEGRAKGLGWEEIAAQYEKNWKAQFMPRYRFGQTFGRAERHPVIASGIFRAIQFVPALFPALVRLSRPAVRLAA